MNEEDFDGSALRELLTPVVADRGRTSVPADAIVAAGRRRVAGRRIAVAGGALAIVAAVPLAASAIAAGPGTANTANTARAGSAPGTTKPAPPTPLKAPAPSRSSAPAQSKGIPPVPSISKPDTSGVASLPKNPILLGAGMIEGKHWSVSAVGSGGNNALTAKSQCLKLIVSEDGRTTDPSLGDRLLYCLPGPVMGYMLEEMQYDIQNGAGNVAIGTVPADVAKIVAHIGGASAPVTIATVPAPAPRTRRSS